MKTTRTDEKGKVTRTRMGKPKPAFTALVQKCELALNFSLAHEEVDDGEGNKINFYLWVSGDWKIDYKGKEYLVPMSENINALINWINEQE